MKIYLDTSVFASIYIQEKHTASILQYLKENQKNQFYISRLVETEFYSVLSLKRRSLELTFANIEKIADVFNDHLKKNIYEYLIVNDLHFKLAIEFLKPCNNSLRTMDSIHLAFCKDISATLVTADKQLVKAAKFFNISYQLI